MKNNKLVLFIILLLSLIISATCFACSSSSDENPNDTDKPTIENPTSPENPNNPGKPSLTPKEQFLLSRNSLISDDSNGFEYNFTFTVSVGMNGLNLSGTQNGNNKYSKDGNISYLNKRSNSGILFNNGTIYEYYTNNEMNEIKINEDQEIVGFTTQKNATKTKYDSSSFAKALFTYKDSDIEDVIKEGNKYLIKSNVKGSNVVSTVIENLDHPIVEKLLKTSLPETTSNTNFYITYDTNNNIDTYVYNFEVSVSAVSLKINYMIDFTKINQAPDMALPTFTNFYVNDNEISSNLTTINNSINAFKTSNYNANEFTLKSGVDFGIENNEINATIKGESKRKYESNTSFFANLIEVDSDLKNADLYKASNLADVKYIRGRLTNEDVYDRKKKTIGYDTPISVNYATRNNMDDYFLLLDSNILNLTNVNSVSTSQKDGIKKYSLTLSNDGILKVLDIMNKSAIINPFIESNATILGNYDTKSINLSSLQLVFELDGTNTLTNISMKMKGKYDTKFIGSRDFNTSDRATFNLEYKFTPKAIESYTVPTSADDLKF